MLDATPVRSLTLVTCYPFYFVGSAPQRYIVRAVLADDAVVPTASRRARLVAGHPGGAGAAAAALAMLRLLSVVPRAVRRVEVCKRRLLRRLQ